MMEPSYYLDFLKKYPAYSSTLRIDELRKTDYARLDRGKHIYLDYTGGGLYADSQIVQHQKLLREQVFGNPHSSNPTSLLATELVEAARMAVLSFFCASPTEYEVIFSQNASGALKVIGEAYPFGRGDQYLLTFDNHNSVNGIREFAHAHGAEVTYVPVALPDMRVCEDQLEEAWGKAHLGGNNLFAYPAQSNFSSVQHPLEWIERAHQSGWDVLLDAAAFVPTNRLDLSQWKPDFVPLSFYKIFGYPTGIGALIARKDKLHKLHRPWFAGGTITVASVQGNRYFFSEGPAAFEDGTIDYLNIPAVDIGLQYISAIGMETIHTRVVCLTGWLLENLKAMKHETGEALVRIYGPVSVDQRGGAITMNFFNAHGRAIDHRLIERAANQVNISLRTGCFCNPGAGEIALGISKPELVACFSQLEHTQRISLDDFRLCIDGKSSGAVRVSIGMLTNFEDVQAFLSFTEKFLNT